MIESSQTPPAWLRWFRMTLGCVLAISALCFIVTTIHWPLVGDATLMHYVVFLMRHGMSPYREIIDINMPGCYAVEWTAMHLFGGGSLSWRLFCFSLSTLAAFAYIVIAIPYDWLAGIFAAVLLFLINGRDGIAQTGQRDLVMAVLLLLAWAFYFAAMRRSKAWLMLCSGLCAGMACTIKPTAALFVIALLLLIMCSFKSKQRAAYFFYGLSGTLVPVLVIAGFLAQQHALLSFYEIFHGLVLFHGSLDHRPLLYLLNHGPSPFMPLLAVWILIAIRQDWRNKERIAIAAGVVCGLISFLAQAKGYPYHRYPFLAFLLLLMGIDFVQSLKQRGWVRILAIAGLAAGAFVIAPVSAAKASHYDGKNLEFTTMLHDDLTAQGVVSGQVQCMDMTSGCIHTLYNMQLVQSTGFLYDCYFFSQNQNAATLALRARFWNEIRKSPPAIFVVTNQYCLNGIKSFDKLAQWPQFQDYLNGHYSLITERKPPHMVKWWNHPEEPSSYRIYRLRE